MRLAVISDIHGNMEAFTQVLNDIDASNIDVVISLGDNIGYGPEPDRVVRLIRDRNIPSVMGNHELAVADRSFIDWFNPVARESLIKTIKLLSEISINYICSQKSFMVDYYCRFVHGFPPKSPITYLFEVPENRLQYVAAQMKEKICFIGHTHTLGIISYDGESIFREPLNRGITHLLKERRYIINIGSVGQPRDGNNNAKYVIWDPSENTIEVKFIPYDISVVAKKILAAGLPEIHASILW